MLPLARASCPNGTARWWLSIYRLAPTVLDVPLRQPPRVAREWSTLGANLPAMLRSKRAGRCQPDSCRRAFRGSCEQLWSAVEAAPDEVWGLPAIGISGEVTVGPALVVGRLREVEVHHVDLAYGYGPDDWPFGWVVEEIERAMLDLPARLPTGMAVVLSASDAGQHWVAGSGTSLEVSGTTGELFAWVTGRTSHVGGFEAPVLKPWR